MDGLPEKAAGDSVASIRCFRLTFIGAAMMLSSWLAVPLAVLVTYDGVTDQSYSVVARVLMVVVGLIALVGGLWCLRSACAVIEIDDNHLKVKVWSQMSRTYSREDVRRVTNRDDAKRLGNVAIELAGGRQFFSSDGCLRGGVEQIAEALTEWKEVYETRSEGA